MTDFTPRELAVAKSVAKRFHASWFEDAESCALQGIWKHRDRWDGRGSYHGWLYTQAYNYAVDCHRIEYGRKGHGSRYMMNKEMRFYDPHNAPEYAVEHRTPEHFVVDMDRDLSYLTEKWTDKEIQIAQKLLEGKTQQQVADEMGVHFTRICQLVKPLKQKIKAGMNDRC